MRERRVSSSRALVLLVVAACGEGGSPAPPPPRDAPPRKVVPAPRGEVRAYPPHAIRSDGVGPYLLDAPLSDVLHSMSEGPRIELLQIGGYADWRLVRAEQGKILIGAQENRVRFIAVLAPEVARIEGGLEVGATGAQLLSALGATVSDGAIRDRQVYRFASLPGVSFFTDALVGTPAEQAKITAVLVTRETAPPSPGKEEGACRSADGAPPTADLVAAARSRPALPSLPYDPRPRIAFGCFTGDAREALVAGAGEVALVALEPPRSGEPGKPRRLATLSVPGADFTLAQGSDTALPFDVDGDGRDEVVVILQRKSAEQRSVELRVHRWENGRLTQVVDDRPFTIDRALAEVAGVTPLQIDLSIAIRRGEGDEPSMTGYYVARKAGVVSELVPLRTSPLRLPRKGGAPAGGDPGAGAPVRDASSAADAAPGPPEPP